MAQIPIRVNKNSILALVDTGAPITITSQQTAPLFGVFSLYDSDIPSAVGMAGVSITLVSFARLHFYFGSMILDHPLYFTDSACIPKDVGSYDLILVNDFLSRFSFDLLTTKLGCSQSPISK